MPIREISRHQMKLRPRLKLFPIVMIQGATPRLRLIALGILLGVGACKKTTDTSVVIETAPAERRSIVLSAQANGTVEPIDIVEVKSKASGTIIKMPVDVGSKVKPGDLLVQIDPRTVQNAYTQAAADLQSATVARTVALAQRNRSA